MFILNNEITILTSITLNFYIFNTHCLFFFFRHGLESNVLRFVARLDTTRPIDMDRR